MKRSYFRVWGCASALLIATAGPAAAHFGMVIPSTNAADQKQRSVDLTLSFSHPFEMVGMDLDKPKQFFAISGDTRFDLLDGLHQTEVMGKPGWQTTFSFQRPGVYQFAMEPQPYWEPAEDLFIIHYTKTVVAAFGADEGWDDPVGLPTEIIPFLRPFGNYAGNSFTGQVILAGAPVPYAEVEVEFYNQDEQFQAPSDYHVTQVVKADANGVFSFTCPLPGWWGFAALNEADFTLQTAQGEDKGVEIGAVLWVYFNPY